MNLKIQIAAKLSAVLALLLFTCTIGLAQITFESDTAKTALHASIIDKAKNIPHDYDFQFRFWAQGVLATPSTPNLFVMTLKNGAWSCKQYKVIFGRKRGKGQVVETARFSGDCDSVWQYCMENKILDLPNMKLLRDKFYYFDENQEKRVVKIMDGAIYTFEFLAQNRYKRIEYHCPVGYSKHYTHIPELQQAANIIKLIYRKMGYSSDPC